MIKNGSSHNLYQRAVGLSLSKTLGVNDLAIKSFAEVLSCGFKDATETLLNLRHNYMMLHCGILEKRGDAFFFYATDNITAPIVLELENDYLALATKYKFSHSMLVSLQNSINLMKERKAYA